VIKLLNKNSNHRVQKSNAEIVTNETNNGVIKDLYNNTAGKKRNNKVQVFIFITAAALMRRHYLVA